MGGQKKKYKSEFEKQVFNLSRTENLFIHRVNLATFELKQGSDVIYECFKWPNGNIQYKYLGVEVNPIISVEMKKGKNKKTGEEYEYEKVTYQNRDALPKKQEKKEEKKDLRYWSDDEDDDWNILYDW